MCAHIAEFHLTYNSGMDRHLFVAPFTPSIYFFKDESPLGTGPSHHRHRGDVEIAGSKSRIIPLARFVDYH